MPRTTKIARVLHALHSAGVLDDEDFKPTILDFIRKATEPSANWHATSHYRSRSAKAAIGGETLTSAHKYQKFCSKTLSHEHVVPNNAIYGILLAETTLTEAIILAKLRYFGLRATITREQNALLTNRFASRMPDGFYRPGDPLHNDPFARYKAVGIFEDLEQLQSPSWHLQHLPHLPHP